MYQPHSSDIIVLGLIYLIDVKPNIILVNHGDADGYYTKVVLSEWRFCALAFFTGG